MSPLEHTVTETYKLASIYQYISSLHTLQYHPTIIRNSSSTTHIIQHPNMTLTPPKQRNNHYNPHIDRYWGDFPATTHLQNPTSIF